MNTSKKGFVNPKNPYSDYVKDKANLVKINADNVKYGNVILGYKKFNDQPWRFGKDLEELNELTIIQIAGVGKHELPTAKVHEYLMLNDAKLRTMDSTGFGFPTSSYVVPIRDLVEYCTGSQEFANA